MNMRTMKQLKSLCTLLLLATTSMEVAVAAPTELKLDIAKIGAPISPYIYGQFVEHLGRCIYGGIWAQMLEDRKFYFPITADYSPYRDLTNSAFPVVGASPWQIIGASSAVAMVKEDAFVGRHSPRINAGAGIRQRDLGLVAGKGYEGYLLAKPLDGSAEIEVALAWGEGEAGRASTRLKFSGGKYSKRTFSFTSRAGTDKGSLEIRVLKGDVLLGPA
jgi:alpha-L-arabinofuranosidase